MTEEEFPDYTSFGILLAELRLRSGLRLDAAEQNYYSELIRELQTHELEEQQMNRQRNGGHQSQ